MSLENLLAQRRDEIIGGWVRATLGAYPADSAKFFESEKDPFANPVGTAVTAGLPGLFDAFLGNAQEPELARRLDRIVQVRCVQEMSASAAVSFVFLLKKVIRENFSKELEDPQRLAELLSLEARIDRMAACAFDVYAGYQKKISELRVHEIKSRVATILKRSGIGDGDLEPNPKEGGPARSDRSKMGGSP